MRALVLGVVLLASAVIAQSRPVQLYVVSKQVFLLKDAKPKAPHVTTLHKGEAVTWMGEVHDGFLRVEHAGKKGFIPRFELTPSKPQYELSPEGKDISPEAFASSGADVKCRYPYNAGPTWYRTPEQQQAAAELQFAEELTKQRATAAELEKKAKQLNP